MVVPSNMISLMFNNSTGSMVDVFDRSFDAMHSVGAITIENTNILTAQDLIDNNLLTSQVMVAIFVVDIEKYSKLAYDSQNTVNWDELHEWTQSSPLMNIRVSLHIFGMQHYKMGKMDLEFWLVKMWYWSCID